MSVQLNSTTIYSNISGVHSLVERPDGSPMRTIATGRRHRPVGTYPSLKCGTAVPWESYNELHSFYLAEVRTDIRKYRAQPHTLHIDEPGKTWRYTPDLELTLADGAKKILEVKGDYRVGIEPEYDLKLSKVGQIYRDQGWSFAVLRMAELVNSRFFSAVKCVQAYRHTLVTGNDLLILDRTCGLGEISLGHLKCAYANPVVGIAKASAMMVQGLIDIDLRDGLNDYCQVVRLEGRR